MSIFLPYTCIYRTSFFIADTHFFCCVHSCCFKFDTSMSKNKRGNGPCSFLRSLDPIKCQSSGIGDHSTLCIISEKIINLKKVEKQSQGRLVTFKKISCVGFSGNFIYF